ncbi:hypothetical protein K435DRAFT_842998 [Dendrothele bispora CBS 962.96]|uniref:Uncharacterized protein n=1 Tax=Dendrothele bispora (strain CBS 962.96) TaxID=1314807 RepID=A0A4S8LBW5_DENBC|nr:hypothetical protein K435DRAFT_842998 [Dendrothele bispora CBS 962.96]
MNDLESLSKEMQLLSIRSTSKINECLTLKYMEDNERWFDLPLTYMPKPDFRHEPPKLVYGFGFRYNELIDYAAKKGLVPPREKIRFGDFLDAWCTAVDQLYIECGLEGSHVYMFSHAPYSKHANLVLVLWDNYSDSDGIPFPEFTLPAKKKMIQIWKKEGIPKRPMWWISDDIDLMVTDYRVPFTGYKFS